MSRSVIAVELESVDALAGSTVSGISRPNCHSVSVMGSDQDTTLGSSTLLASVGGSVGGWKS